MSDVTLGPNPRHALPVDTAARARVTGRPSRGDLVDAGFVFGLGLLALFGFRTTFDSWRFLLVGGIGLALGIAIAHLANLLRQHWLVLAVMTIVTFFLLGGALAMSREAIAGFIPNLPILSTLAQLSVRGWKELLTTLPPVDGDGQFLALPYLLGLLVGAGGFAWARRSRSMAWPALAPLALFVTVLLLGTLTPAGALLQGLAFTALLFLWVTLRRRRALRVVGTGSSARSQAAIGGVLLAVSLAAAAGLVAALPATDGAGRTVLRTYVAPPFDIAQHPSPLVGFRKYVKGAKRLWDKDLFTVTGVEPGQRVRIAVLDSYSGTVWSAGSPTSSTGSAFRRVGTTIAPAVDDSTTPPETATVTIAPAYAAERDLDVWLPGVGAVSQIDFSGAHSRALAESLRYNTATGMAVVSTRLAPGDSYTVTGRPVADVPEGGIEPGGASVLDGDEGAFVTAQATKWADKKPTTWEQVAAVAAAMKANGAYSDGTAGTEQQYLPGHSQGRLTTFLGARQIVGNDEQYASSFALMANQLGMPARVVLGAEVPTSGAVKGKDVRAWVEVRGSTGGWYAVPQSLFMDRNKKPDQTPPPQVKADAPIAVPPPNAIRPPGALDSLFDADPSALRTKAGSEKGFEIPAWVWTVLTFVGIPLAVIVGFAGLLALLRGIRSRRRRTRGPAHRRLAHGWNELVDRARDLGITVPTGLTRHEQAALVGRPDLAAAADRATFGAVEPADEAVAAFWAEARRAAAKLTGRAPRRNRLLRRVSLRSLLTRDTRDVETSLRATPARRGLPVLRATRSRG